MARALWLADVLRADGLPVREVSGWTTRSATEDTDASTFTPRGLIIHETRSPRIASDADEIRVLANGRVGLSGPIAQLYLGRDGTWHVVASGLCHHVKAGWGGPFTGLGNTKLLGIEAAHTVTVVDGKRLETWADKPSQYESYVRGVAAIRRHTGWPAPVGHKEHQPGDKPDPEFSMDRFRADVARVLSGDDFMATINQADWDALIWRVEALVSARDTIAGGPQKGQAVPFVAAVKALAGDQVDEAAIIAGVLAGLSPQAIADLVVAALPPELARGLADELAARLQG